MKTIKALVAATALTAALPTLAQDVDIAKLPATKSGKITAPAEGKGQVVFYRPGSLMGAALGCTIYDNGKQIARLGSGKYWVHQAEPGKALFNTRAENVDQLNMEIEPGETYFVKCKIGVGIVAGRPNIAPSTADEFIGKAKGLKLWEPDGKVAAELAKSE